MFVGSGSVLIVLNIMQGYIFVIKKDIVWNWKKLIKNLFFMILRYVKMIFFIVNKVIFFFVLDVEIVLRRIDNVLNVDCVEIVRICYVDFNNIKLILQFYRLFVICVRKKNQKKILNVVSVVYVVLIVVK